MTFSLVTGASGFIGGHLVDALLAQDQRVRCLVRSTSSVDLLERPGVELSTGDLTDSESVAAAVRDVDTVYHLGGLTHALHARDLYHVNGLGAWNVARACAKQKHPPVLVYVSSLAAAGPGRFQQRRREQDPVAPVSDYGRSKRAGELAVMQFAQRTPTTIVRPGVVFGPRDKASLALFQPVAKAGIFLLPTFQPTRLAMIHVADLVDVLIEAADHGERLEEENSKVSGRGVYFAAADTQPSFRQLAYMLAEACGRSFVSYVHVPEFVLWLAAGSAELAARCRGKASIFNFDKLAEMLDNWWQCDTEKATRDLRPRHRPNLQERLAETAAWYREHGWM